MVDGNTVRQHPTIGLCVGQLVKVCLFGSPSFGLTGRVVGFHPIERKGGYDYLVEVCIESADGLGQFRSLYYPHFLSSVSSPTLACG